MASSLIHYEPSNAGVSVLDDMSTLKENAHVSVTVAAATSNNGGVAVLESQIIALQRQLTTLMAERELLGSTPTASPRYNPQLLPLPSAEAVTLRDELSAAKARHALEIVRMAEVQRSLQLAVAEANGAVNHICTQAALLRAEKERAEERAASLARQVELLSTSSAGRMRLP